MPMLADCVDAVIGVDTHRDTHEAEIAHSSGAPIRTHSVSNDCTGYAELLAWIVDHAPSARIVVANEGARSYGAGLAHALVAAGLTVIECEEPSRTTRRGAVNPTRSMRTWLCSTPSSLTPTTCPPHAPTVTAKRCACSSPPEKS